MLDFIVFLSYYKGWQKRKQLGNDSESLDHTRGYLDSERMEKGVNPSRANIYQKSGGFFGVFLFPPLYFYHHSYSITTNNSK